MTFITNDAPYKNKDEICEELKSIKDPIIKQHVACKGILISTPILRLDNKEANTILKRYLEKLKGIELNSVILDDNILSICLNKDCLHLNN